MIIKFYNKNTTLIINKNKITGLNNTYSEKEIEKICKKLAVKWNCFDWTYKKEKVI